jgi:hypothetical protein
MGRARVLKIPGVPVVGKIGGSPDGLPPDIDAQRETRHSYSGNQLPDLAGS